MDGPPKVAVVKYGDRDALVLRWTCPETGKFRTKSAGTSKRREAERAAAALEREIANGQHGRGSRMNWLEFRIFHAKHCLAGLAPKTRTTYSNALNTFERLANPTKLADATATRILAMQTALRSEGKADATIANYTRSLKATLRWAHAQGLLAVVPKIAMPKRVKGSKSMKGRPITAEEFDRMVAAVPKVVGTDAATVAAWKFYLTGLWCSGLRLSESLALRWDDSPGALVVDLTRKRPMLRIPAEAEKGNQDRILPMAPEFAVLLGKIPVTERRGRVFKLPAPVLLGSTMQAGWVGRIVSQIGEKARIMVDQRERTLKLDARTLTRKKPAKEKAAEPAAMKVKYASAHDLRRAFGLRWSARIMPAVLQQLMRHESVETTMKFYVGRDADSVADVLWAAAELAAPVPSGEKSNKPGNSDESDDSGDPSLSPQSLAR
jgi:integrase